MRARNLILAGLILLLAYWIAAATGWPVWLRGPLNPYGWNWPMLRERRHVIPVLLVSLASAAAVWYAAEKMIGVSSARRRWALALLPLTCVTLMIAFLAVKNRRPLDLLLARSYSENFLGHVQTAAIATFHDLTGGYPEFHPRVCFHCHMHPPGTMLFHWLFLRLCQALPHATELGSFLFHRVAPGGPSLAGGYFVGLFVGTFAILIAGAMTPLVVYRIARADADERTAYLVAACTAFAPGLVLMVPEFDQLEALPPAIAYWLAIRSVDNPRASWLRAACAGAALGLGVWFTFLVAAFGLPLGLIWFLRGRFDWRRGLGLSAAGLGGFVAFYLILWLTTGTHIVRIWHTVSDMYFGHPTNLGRSYWRFFFANPLDFAHFVGLPCMLVALASLARKHPARLHTLAGLAVVLVIDILGVQRGETGRTFICFAMLIHLGTLPLLASASWAPRALFALQAVGTTVIGLSWYVP